MRLLTAAIALAAFAPASARQAVPDSGAVALPALEVRAGRMLTAAVSPGANTVVRDETVRDTRPAPTLADVLDLVPGVDVEDRGHLALGERISVRGLGGRAAFGVRGVHVLLDGMPLTLPDGQAVTEIVEPAIVRRAELLRGPAGRLWGNGSGGVIAITSSAATSEAPGFAARMSAGAFGSRQVVAEAVAAPGTSRLHAYGSWRRTEGSRVHSEGRLLRAGAGAVIPLGSGPVLRAAIAGVSQDVRHPGSLTSVEADDDPTAADPRYRSTDSGKRSSQVQGLLRLVAGLGRGVLEADAYGTARDLDNPLPFAWIGIDRRAGGLRIGWNREVGRLSLRLGADAAFQGDDRVNADNDGGRRGATTVLDQRETVRSAALSAIAEWTPAAGWTVASGLRVDRVGVRLRDRLQGDGDQSGRRTFTAASPGVSVAWTNRRWTAHAGWSTAFDVPTTTELVNSPDGLPGFNPEVGPQRTHGFEAGIRGGTARWSLDVTLYTLRVRDLLSPFQDEASGRTFYVNDPGARHLGADLAFDWAPDQRIRIRGFAEVQRFRYDDGATLPGLPARRAGASIDAGSRLLRGEIRLEALSWRYGDDDNTGRIDGHALLDVRLYHRGLQAGTTTVRPFVELRNAMDVEYAASVVVNARGARYVEPGPGRALSAGLTVRVR